MYACKHGCHAVRCSAMRYNSMLLVDMYVCMHSMHACMHACMSGLLEFLDASIQVCIVLHSDVLCCNVLKCMEYIYAWMHAFTCAFFFACMYVCQCMFFLLASMPLLASVYKQPHKHIVACISN